MKKLLLVFSLIISATILSCSSSNDEPKERACGTYNGKALFVGPKEGCYYYNSNGNKTYVERKECSCLN